MSEEIPSMDASVSKETAEIHQSPDTTTVAEQTVTVEPAESGHTPTHAKEPLPSGSKSTVSSSKDIDRRKFRVLGLTYPAALDIVALRKLMAEAQSFHFWFERNPLKRDDLKKGGLSLLFDSETEAKEAFESIKNTKVAGQNLKLNAHKVFHQPEEPIIEDPELSQKLFVHHLLPSFDETVLRCVFDSENIKAVEILLDENKKDGSKVAIITFHTCELADQAKSELDGFTIDDGEVARPMKIVTYLDYLKKKKQPHEPPSRKRPRIEAGAEPEVPEGTAIETKAGSAWSAQIRDATAGRNSPAQPITVESPPTVVAAPVQRPQITPTSDMTPPQVVEWIDYVMSDQRVNWAELTNAQDLWSVLDKTCEQSCWLPDTILRDGMLQTLERQLAESPPDWMYRHLEALIKTWKKEMAKGDHARSNRQYQLQAPSYDPPVEQKKPKIKNAEHKRQLVGLMGVGALLANARDKFQTEDGEVNEDETQPEPEKGKPAQKIKIKIKKRPRKPPSSSPESAKELEEGEMATSSNASSDDSSSYDDSSSTESSSDSSEEEKPKKKGWKSRDRRRKMRKKERRKKKQKDAGKSFSDQMKSMMPQMMQMFGQMYQSRMSMFQRMTPEQKTQMQSMFRQFQSQGQVPSQPQMQALAAQQPAQPLPAQPAAWANYPQQQQAHYYPPSSYGQQPAYYANQR